MGPGDSSPGASPATARTPSASLKRPVAIGGSKALTEMTLDEWRDSPPKKKGKEEKTGKGSNEKEKSSKSKKKGRPELVRRDSNTGRRRSSVSTGMSKIEPRALRGFCADRTPVVLELAAAQQAARGLGLSQANLKHLRDRHRQFGRHLLQGAPRGDGGEAHPTDDASFRLIDLDGNGEISFDEFVCCLVSYCI